MSGRILAVDVMRGLTMAAMIVVNNPGSWAHMAPVLEHAAWGGWLRPADLVFPSFLFLVGVATPLALHRRRERGASRRSLLGRAARRAAILLAIGLFLNLFPQFDLATVRVPGVLQRIAVVYLGCATALLWLRPLVGAASAVVIVLFLESGTAGVVVNTGTVLITAGAAGFSERIVTNAMLAVADKVKPGTSKTDGGSTG